MGHSLVHTQHVGFLQQGGGGRVLVHVGEHPQAFVLHDLKFSHVFFGYAHVSSGIF